MYLLAGRPDEARCATAAVKTSGSIPPPASIYQLGGNVAKVKGAARAKIEDGQIVIRVDISSLGKIVKYGPNNEYSVTDEKKFAKAIVKSLNDEDNDTGETSFQTFLNEKFDDVFYDSGEELKDVGLRDNEAESDK